MDATTRQARKDLVKRVKNYPRARNYLEFAPLVSPRLFGAKGEATHLRVLLFQPLHDPY
jgi:hypothetical protein